MVPVVLATMDVPARLFMGDLGAVQIQQGSMSFRMDLDYQQVETQMGYLHVATVQYDTQCLRLAAFTKTGRCQQMNETLHAGLTELVARGDYIRKFFPNRTPRGIWSYLGVMDSDDRQRVDGDLDTLRGNEERLKLVASHQTNVVEALYKEIAKATEQVDENMRKMQEEDHAIRAEVESGLNFTGRLDQIVALEQSLSETGLWIIQMAHHVRQQQLCYLRVLTHEQLHVSDLLELVNPNTMLDRLGNHAKELPTHVRFPASEDGVIVPEIFEVITLERVATAGRQVRVRLNVPLVQAADYEAFKGTVSPAITGRVLAVIPLVEDVLVVNERRKMGYVLAEAALQACTRVRAVRLCSFELPLVDLPEEAGCLTQMYYHNRTTGCEVKMVETPRVIWLASPKRNEWIYVAPVRTQAYIEHGEIRTPLNLQGVGSIDVQPGTTLRTTHTTITPYWDDEANDTLPVPAREVGMLQLTIPLFEGIHVPELNTTNTSFVTQEFLLRHAIDVRDLQSMQPVLKNIVYAPLKHPWVTTPAVLVAAVLLFLAVRYWRQCRGDPSPRDDPVPPSPCFEIELPVLSGNHRADHADGEHLALARLSAVRSKRIPRRNLRGSSVV